MKTVVDIKECSACGQDHEQIQTVEQVGGGRCSRTDCPAPKGLCVAQASPDYQGCEHWMSRFFYCPSRGSKVFVTTDKQDDATG